MIHTNTISMKVNYGSSVVGVNSGNKTLATAAEPSLYWESDSLTASLVVYKDADGNLASGAVSLPMGLDAGTPALDGVVVADSASPWVSFYLVGLTSVSPAVNITVTPFLEKLLEMQLEPQLSYPSFRGLQWALL
jgi:hypothetical protein